ncbi:hypothetical protein XavaCFBP5823_00290 [Xanthomonas axonopodis pv. vasculorum]|nr:hypothetical protein XavaCFBP5823_00290 [Xanthomonas axonopodis pv. vasculorum]
MIAGVSAQLHALGAALRRKEALQQWQQGRLGCLDAGAPGHGQTQALWVAAKSEVRSACVSPALSACQHAGLSGSNGF